MITHSIISTTFSRFYLNLKSLKTWSNQDNVKSLCQSLSDNTSEAGLQFYKHYSDLFLNFKCYTEGIDQWLKPYQINAEIDIWINKAHQYIYVEYCIRGRSTVLHTY
jgi:hypothetical protein